MRLWSRAFYFEDPEGNRLVLVSCDLFAVPASLTASVARQVADLGLSPDELVIAATHTHQGPGNFLSTRGYNDFGSTYSGFDKDLFDSLAERIAKSIRDAAKQARDSSEKVELLLRRGRWVGFVRNRAPEVFLLNSNRDLVMNELNPEPGTPCKPSCPHPEYACEPLNGWELGETCPRLRATDPNLTLLEVRRGTDASKPPLGLLVFFSVHPTVLRHEAPLFSSDFTGWAVDSLERELVHGNLRSVVGFFNGADGDISARRLRRDLKDVVRLGKEFVSVVQDLREKTAGSDVSGPIDVRVAPGPTNRPCPSQVWQMPNRETEIQLATQPMYGVAGIGGGEGDRTVLFQLGWSDGVRGEPTDGQAPKQPALDSPVVRHLDLTAAISKADTFPNALPVTLARLGKLTIATMPAELTTAMAFEIRRKLKFHERPFVLVGPANDYSSYVTSPAEYASQDYAAASTIWGANEGPFLGCLLEGLSKAKPPIRLDRVDALRFRPGPKPKKPYGPFGPSFLASRRSPDEELDRLLVGADGRTERHLPYVEWEEWPPAPDNSEEEFKAVSRRTVAVLSHVGQPVPDGQGELLTMLVDSGVRKRIQEKPRKWAAIWVRPLWDSPKGRFAFHVTTGDGGRCTSMDFDPAVILATDPPNPIPMKCSGRSVRERAATPRPN